MIAIITYYAVAYKPGNVQEDFKEYDKNGKTGKSESYFLYSSEGLENQFVKQIPSNTRHNTRRSPIPKTETTTPTKLPFPTSNKMQQPMKKTPDLPVVRWNLPEWRARCRKGKCKRGFWIM